MNENVNLKEILKDCPKGWGFWSKVHGEVTFRKINPCTNTYPIEVFSSEGIQCVFTENGRALSIHEGECILVPSKDQQDWSKFYAPWYNENKFDPKTLKPFDKVLVRDDYKDRWFCRFFWISWFYWSFWLSWSGICFCSKCCCIFFFAV